MRHALQPMPAAMPARGRADNPRPLAAALTPTVQHLRSIDDSHQRCAMLGLSRIGAPDLSPVLRSDLQVTIERNRRLYAHAAPIMETLYEQIAGTHSMVVLTDATGTVLHATGDDDFLDRASKVALAPGANWSEPTKGTNAVGTALVREAPTLVHADEHYLHANHFLTCSAAPIMDPRGNILGVLDVSGDYRSYHRHTMGLVTMSARMIENHWLTDDFREALRLHFHSRPEFIGTLMEGILAVTEDGRIVGANRGALEQLGVNGAGLRQHALPALIGISVHALVDHFRTPMAPPLPVVLPDGRHIHVHARFNWPVWIGLKGAADAARFSATGAAAAPATTGTAGAEPIGSRTGSAPPQAAATPGAETGRGAAMAARPVARPLPPRDGALAALRSGDAVFDSVLDRLQRVVDRDLAVLILGEAGSGKETLARAFHADSQRGRQPFVAFGCAGLSPEQAEIELFGCEADRALRRNAATGCLVRANGGTLFIDDIAELPMPAQARLLRVLKERQLVPLGARAGVAVDVTLICASAQALGDCVAQGRFRDDLYYRLNGLTVRLPALRERSDLDELIQRILARECAGRPPRLAPEVRALLQHCRWPGNLRQLQNVLRAACVLAGDSGNIGLADLPDDLQPKAEPAAAPMADHAPLPMEAARSLDDLELDAIRAAMEASGGNISAAAKQLGISRNTIYRRLRWKPARQTG